VFLGRDKKSVMFSQSYYKPLGYLMLQPQRLLALNEILMYDKKVRIWKEAVVAYFNILFQHSFGNGENPQKAQSGKTNPAKIPIGYLRNKL
jgi:hypothetical protein